MSAPDPFEESSKQADHLRMDIFDSADTCGEVTVSTGVGDRELLVVAWMESHSPDGGRGAHIAVRQAETGPLVVHLSRVPAFMAAVAEVSLWLAQLWERDGQSYWAGHPVPPAASPQDPIAAGTEPSVVGGQERDENRRQRRASKRDVLELVHAHAPEVLASFLSAEDDEAATVALAQLLGTSDETARELVTHLQFRELTEASRRQRQSSDV